MQMRHVLAVYNLQVGSKHIQLYLPQLMMLVLFSPQQLPLPLQNLHDKPL